MLRRPAPSHAVICCNSVYGQRLKTSPSSAAGWIAGWFARWFGGRIIGRIEGDNRKQNCNEHVARSIPTCVTAAILSCGVDKDIVQDVPDSVFMA